MKPRPDSTLSQLTNNQLDQLYDWLTEHTYREVIAIAANAPPHGFGMNLHKTTLVRFYGRERARRHAEALAEAKLDQALAGNAAELLQQTTLQLAHASYEMSLGPLSAANFNNLSRALHRRELMELRRSQVEINQRQLGLNEERVALEQQRLDLDIRQFEYSAVEAAAKHAAELNQIAADPNLNDRQKYSMARDVVFGSLDSQGGASLSPARRLDRGADTSDGRNRPPATSARGEEILIDSPSPAIQDKPASNT